MRWCSYLTALERALKLFIAIIETLEEIYKIDRSQSINHYISQEYLINLAFYCYILEPCYKLTKILQRRDLMLGIFKTKVRGTLRNLSNLKKESG